MDAIDTPAVRSYFRDLQDRITEGLVARDAGGATSEEAWQHGDGGGGLSRVRVGPVIERGGVNFSYVHGPSLPPAATVKRPELAGRSFEAMGVSVVIHPRNPYVPTAHANVRLLVAHAAGTPPVWWFGGGMDLTPYYGFDEDVRHWHRVVRAACEPFGADAYARFKQQCDDYFFLKHRGEPRGVGGIFFDDLAAWGFARSFAFVRAVGDAFAQAYWPLVERRSDTPYGERERDFQLYRRGRYVEFNLIYDRGTLFGLQTGGRAEAILMSLPPLAAWRYNWKPEPGTPEARLYEVYLKPQNWA